DINCSKLTGDDEGTVTLSINGTTYSTGTGGLGNATSFNNTGEHNATCVYTASQNYTTTSTIFWISVVDFDDLPNVTLIEPVANYVNDSAETITVNFSCSATDNYNLTNISLHLTDALNTSFAYNQTTSINGTTNESSWSVDIGINGNYTWSCIAYDNNSQFAWADENRTIILNYSAPVVDPAPYWNTNNSNYTVTYDNTSYSEFNISWYDDVSVSIVYFESNYSGTNTNYSMTNSTLNSYNYSALLPAGGHFWRSYANDSVNGLNTSDYYNFTITESASTVNLTLNYSSSNITVTNGSLIDINCSKLTGDDEGTVTLSINGTTYSTGTGGLGNATSFNNTGEHNATCVYTASQNYTTTSTIFWISVVAQDNAPNTTLITPTASYTNDSTENVNVDFNCTATDDTEIANISLYVTNSDNGSFTANVTTSVNGTTNSSNWTLSLGTGNYTWNCLTYDNNSQTAWGNNHTIVINRTNSTLESNISVGNSSTIHLVGREEHNVTIDSVTATSASITISSTPVTFTISVGETKNLDLEGGSSYDHAVTLSSVSGSSAVVTITPINVAVSSSDTTSTGGSTGGSSSSSSSSEAAAPATPTTPATIPGESRQPAAPSTPGESAQQAAPTTAGEDAQQGRQPLAGRAFWTDFKEIAGDYSTYWIGFVIFMILLIFVFVTVPKVMRRLHTPKKVLPPHHYFREPNTTPPRKYYPRKEQDKKVVKITKRKFDNDLDKEMDKINAKISGLRKGDILPSHKKSFVLQEIKKRSSYDKKLQGKLQDVNNQLQGYAKVQILKEPKDRSLNQKLKKVEKKLSEIDTIGSEKKTFVLREMKERASYNNRLEDKLREINNQLHGYAKLKKPKAYQNKKLIQKLKKVEKELAEVNTINSKKKSFVLKETRRRTSYNKKLEHKYDDVKEKLQKYTKPRRSNEPKDKKLLQKLKQVEKKLAKINKIEPPKKKSSIELREEQKAKNDVKRISKKIEKKRPAPPNELHNIEKKIKKLQDDIRNN
ncbi:hypothetical protein HOJ75_04825, partial [Candidatus Woesearchaeota archaeon]|nr:hypothetical protein [Candidatus Woesearchaeota archaeon]